ncbi:hypothetical protein DENSPDRAFT_885719, partial [Dentipellis sp. KUC8613]
EADGGRIGLHISQNRNRPEKEEGEAERFLLGLSKARIEVARKEQRLGRKLAKAEKEKVMEAASQGFGGKSADSLLKYPYVVDLAWEMRKFGSHFVNWDNFNTTRARQMFVGVHGQMLTAIAERGLRDWRVLMSPTEFPEKEVLTDLIHEVFEVREKKENESDEKFGERVKAFEARRRKLEDLFLKVGTEFPLNEVLWYSTFLADANMLFIETLGTTQMMTLLGTPWGQIPEYDLAFDRYIKGVYASANRNIKQGMFRGGDADQMAVMKKHFRNKLRFILEVQRDGRRPQMPLFTTAVLGNIHTLMSSVDDAIAEVIRWLEPGFDMSKANMTKGGWKDMSESFHDWMAVKCNKWYGGLENAFQEWALFVFGRRRMTLERLLWMLHKTGCKYIVRPVKKAEYEDIFDNFDTPGLRQAQAWEGKGQRWKAEMHLDEMTPADFMMALKSTLAAHVRFEEGKKTTGVQMSLSMVADQPVVALYLATVWRWWHRNNPDRAGDTHGLLGCVEYGIVFCTRPATLVLPEVQDMREDLLLLLRSLDMRENPETYRYLDEVFLADEIERVQEQGFEPPPNYDDSEWLLKQVDDARLLSEDRRQAVEMVTRILRSKWAMAVRPTGTGRGAAALPEWKRDRERAMLLRTKVAQKVYDAGTALMDALTENVTQQRIRSLKNDLDWPLGYETLWVSSGSNPAQYPGYTPRCTQPAANAEWLHGYPGIRGLTQG